MSRENEKDFNAMLLNNKDMPKIEIIKDEKSINKYGGNRMLLAPPIDYDTYMKKIPEGKVICANQIRDALTKKYKTDFTDPMTAGIFINIVA